MRADVTVLLLLLLSSLGCMYILYVKFISVRKVIIRRLCVSVGVLVVK